MMRFLGSLLSDRKSEAGGVTPQKIVSLTEQIIAILRQTDTGKTVEEICRGNNLSEQTFYRWGKKYGNLELADALAI